MSVLEETPTRDSVRELVAQFHTFITVYLTSLVHRGRIRPHHISLSLPHIAVDCIAPPFERDASGRLPPALSVLHKTLCHHWKVNDRSPANAREIRVSMRVDGR